MRKFVKFLRIRGRILHAPRRARYDMDKLHEMEANRVSALVKKLDQINIPPTVARELGLSSDWKKKVSPAFVEKVATTAVRHEKLLKELSKY